MEFAATAYVALFAEWPGRSRPVVTPRAARVLSLSTARAEAVLRLRAVGYVEAADILADDDALEQAHRVLTARARDGWEPILPSDLPPRMRDVCGRTCPPLLWGYGWTPSLQTPGLSIVGSRCLSPDEARFASEAGAEAARLGMPVFSGGAAGADSFGAVGAAREGGSAAHFLPGGCREPSGPIALFCSDPDAPPFDRLEALARNRWIYASSEATLVVASRFGVGGSWAGAIAAMRCRLGRILVYLGRDPSDGNVALAKLGATPIESLRDLREAIGKPLQPRLAV